MKKICLIAYGDPKSPATWSRTPSRMYDFFKQKEDEIITYDLKKAMGFRKKLHDKLGRVIYNRGTLRDPGIYSYAANIFSDFTYSSEAEVYLFAAEHCLDKNRRKDAKYYVYLDALMRPYYKYDNRRHKLFYKSYLGLYEKNDMSSFREMSGVFTQNQWSKDFLISEYGLPENKVYNIGFGINAEYYLGNKDYENQKMMIVLRRGTEYRKGLFLLIDAFKLVRKNYTNATLEVYGTTAERVDGITYHENCPREEMIDMYKKASIYIMPNILEPNGITYLEALAAKTPIIGLNRFAFPEFSDYGRCGFICEEENAECLASVIVEALSNPLRLSEYGLHGQKYVKERYDWGVVLEKMRDIINNN